MLHDRVVIVGNVVTVFCGFCHGWMGAERVEPMRVGPVGEYDKLPRLLQRWLELHYDKRQTIRPQLMRTPGEPLQDVVDRDRDAFLALTSRLECELEATKRKLEATTADTRVLQDRINSYGAWRDEYEAMIGTRLDGFRHELRHHALVLAWRTRPWQQRLADWLSKKEAP